MSKCLYCYNDLEENEADYHNKCCKTFFGTNTPPQIPFGLNEIKELAIQVLGKNISVTGVQPKLSLETQKKAQDGTRLTIVGLWGNYILKPPIEKYPSMPENEDLTMHLAEQLKIKTAKHTLVRLKSGELAYLTKRFDREKKSKLHVEDMAQLTETLTEYKYKGSMEKIGKVIKQYSTYPGIDLLAFYELALFSFITGNADMHLKNFSLMYLPDDEISLSPAYDLLSTKLLIKEDNEEMALPLNGKKSNFKKEDFVQFAEYLGINKTRIQNVHKKFEANIQAIRSIIQKSFLPDPVKLEYENLLVERTIRVF